MTIHRFFPDDIKQTIDLGSGLKLHLLVEGRPADGRTFCFEHPCKEVPDEDEPDGVCSLVIAPQLQEGHRASWVGDSVSIFPSILCPDCGTHGFVRANRWESA